jgi:hypothetical protein
MFRVLLHQCHLFNAQLQLLWCTMTQCLVSLFVSPPNLSLASTRPSPSCFWGFSKVLGVPSLNGSVYLCSAINQTQPHLLWCHCRSFSLPVDPSTSCNDWLMERVNELLLRNVRHWEFRHNVVMWGSEQIREEKETKFTRTPTGTEDTDERGCSAGISRLIPAYLGLFPLTEYYSFYQPSTIHSTSRTRNSAVIHWIGGHRVQTDAEANDRTAESNYSYSWPRLTSS